MDWKPSTTAVEARVETKAILAEYAALRDEVNNNSLVVAQVFTISITGMAAVIGFAVQQHDWRLCLVPALLLLPSLLFISSQLDSTIRIAAYIHVFIEPRLSDDLTWETALKRSRNVSDQSRTNYLNSLLGLYLMIILTCVVLGALFLPNQTLPTDFTDISQVIATPLIQYAAGAILILLLTIYTVAATFRSFSRLAFPRAEKRWRQVLQEIENERLPRLP